MECWARAEGIKITIKVDENDKPISLTICHMNENGVNKNHILQIINELGINLKSGQLSDELQGDTLYLHQNHLYLHHISTSWGKDVTFSGNTDTLIATGQDAEDIFFDDLSSES